MLIGQGSMVVYSLFHKHDRKFRNRKGRRSKSKIYNELIDKHFSQLLASSGSCCFTKDIRVYILGLPRRKLGEISKVLNNFLLWDELPGRIGILIRDFVRFRNSPRHNIDYQADNKRFISILFHSKGMDMVNLPSLLHNKNVISAIPSCIDNTPPIVSYRYTSTIASKVFNHKKVVSEIDFTVGSKNLTCGCIDSPYLYGPAGHVVTGNLRIINNGRICKLLVKGPSYREQNNINWNRLEMILLEAVRAYKVRWAKREHFDVRILNEWHNMLNECIGNRIDVLRRKKKPMLRKVQVLKNGMESEYLKQFHQQFVLVPADKAGNNIIVVCKKYYVDVVIKELMNVGLPSTYVASNDSHDHIVSKHLYDLRQWNINVPSVMEQLPAFYWLPKLHKDPYGSRFIAASNRCTTKPLSELLTKCLTTVLIHFREYCGGIFRNTGVNCFWVINNAQAVLHSMQTLNNTSTAKTLDTFDFSTLYTTIPHHSLKKHLIEEAFKVRGALYLSITKRGKCFWNTDNKFDSNITVSQLLDMVNYLVDNVYISVGNKVFRQCIGIPMGTDCAPLLANLYLFHFEYKYMKGLVKNNMSKARTFSDTFRYIDDLLTLNNPSFENAISEIYPSELVFKKPTENSGMVSYLDVGVIVTCGQFITTVYDKRDSFNFPIVNVPFMSSNIPAVPSYGIC